MLIPSSASVTPFALKLRDKPADDWYRRARLALRGGDGGEHGQLLYQLVRERRGLGRPLVALDIGTARGFSAVTMARALIDGGLDGHVYTVDVIGHDEAVDWHRSKHAADDPLATGPIARSAVWSEWAADEVPRVTPMGGRSTDILRDWPHGRIDVAFLDGSHTYDDVKAELDVLSERMVEAGVIVLDDVHFGVVVGRVRSRAASVFAWLAINGLRTLMPRRHLHKARLGVSAEYAIVERRFTGIRNALVEFMLEHDREWHLELVPMPRRGAYQTVDYALAVLTRRQRCDQALDANRSPPGA